MEKYKFLFPEIKIEQPNVLKQVPKIGELQFPTPKLKYNDINPFKPGSFEWKLKLDQDFSKQNFDYKQNKEKLNNTLEKPNLLDLGNLIKNVGISAISDGLTDKINPFKNDDSEFGRAMGTLFSQGVSSAGNNMADNLVKGVGLMNGLEKNVGSSLAGTGAGLAANYLGQGITSAMGDSRLGRAVGQGISTGLGTVGGTVLSNLINTGKAAGTASKLFGTGNNIFTTTKTVTDATTGAKTAQAVGAINPYALGATVLGSALGAATGPSKEYGGKYGNITQIMDTAYDLTSAGVNFIPGVGQGISGIMALNKGLSNIFGSTDGMTVQDAILGSAFMPAPVKWLNMAGSSRTGSFNNQSWQNSEKVNLFMGNAFGNLGDKFDQAREEAGKTYGTFSQGAKREAQENIDFANYAWNRIMQMANQNKFQNIRAQDMSSINNQRYAQYIQGGFKPLVIGKQGMKIFNNATNHNIGMRLLSGAALIDNKAMILCSVVD